MLQSQQHNGLACDAGAEGLNGQLALMYGRYIENFPGFISIMGIDLTDKFRCSYGPIKQ